MKKLLAPYNLRKQSEFEEHFCGRNVKSGAMPQPRVSLGGRSADPESQHP
nr:MAG TPA: hypothetical protein [Caudoviricetes sp.]